MFQEPGEWPCLEFEFCQLFLCMCGLRMRVRVRVRVRVHVRVRARVERKEDGWEGGALHSKWVKCCGIWSKCHIVQMSCLYLKTWYRTGVPRAS